MNTRIEDMPAIRVVFIRGIGPYGQTFPKIWPLINALAKRCNLRKPGTLSLSIAHNNPRTTAPEAIVGDACISVPDDFELDHDAKDNGIQIQTIPAGRYLIAQYVGPYDKLASAWGEFCDQVLPKRNVRTRKAPPFEIYRTDPATTAPDKTTTDLCMPIE
jgi:AraC family transcriptional regulator